MPGARRQIERRRLTIRNTGFDNVQGDDIIHTADDAKTLIRIKGSLWVYTNTEILSEVFGDMVFHIKPAGQAVVTPTVTAAEDQVVPLQELFRIPTMVERTLNASPEPEWGIPQYFEFDTKVQRKMKKNDELVLSHLTTSSLDCSIFGHVYAWFKE